MKKTVLTPFTILCLLSTVFLIGLPFHIQPVKASETIYLTADGSVDPPTAPISSVDNITYTLTDNINDSIVVWRDNIVVDGVGHVLQGTGSGTGIGLSGTENVTVKNIGITGWYYGIGYHGCVNASISANTIVNNCHGIWFNQSSNNKISGNALAYNNVGICLHGSSSQNNSIFHNNFVNNTNQALVYHQFVNLWDNGYPSGGNYWSDYEERYPNATEMDGSGVWDTPYVINDNNEDSYPLMNPRQISPHYPVANFTYSDTVPQVGMAITFDASSSFDTDEDIISYFWDFGDGNTNSTVDPVVVHTYAYHGTFNVTLTVMDSEGLNSSCYKMLPVMMPTSISISTSASSTFVGFKVNVTGTLRDIYQIELENETVVLYYTFTGISTWTPITSDTTDSLGHYHAVWIPPATGYFTIKAEWGGNETHLGTSNTTTLSSLTYNNQYVFSVESNSTVSGLAFNTTDWTLSFTATGPDGTEGYVRVTVAKSLVENITRIRVYLNSTPSEYSITSMDDSWVLTFHYIHSIHHVVVDLDINIIPEFSSFILVPLFMISTLLAVIVYRRKHSI